MIRPYHIAIAGLAAYSLASGCDAFVNEWRIAGATTSRGPGGAGGSAGGIGGTDDGGAGGAGGIAMVVPPYPVWCRFYGALGNQRITDVRLSPDGSLVGAGEFTGDLTDGGIPISSTTPDGFVVRFDLEGNVIGAARLGATTSGFLTSAVPVAADRVIAVGSFAGTIERDAGSATSRVDGGTDVVAAEFAGSPGLGAGADLLLTAGSAGADIAWDGDAFQQASVRKLVLTGRSASGIDFGAGSLDGSGHIAFVDLAGGGSGQAIALGASPGVGHAVRFDKNGFVWAVSRVGSRDASGATGISCAEEITLDPAITDQSVLLKLTTTGKCLLGRVLPPSVPPDPDLVLIDGERPALSGRFQGELEIDGFRAVSSGDLSDAFLLFLDDSAKATGLTTYGGLGTETPDEVVVSATGFIFVAGEFTGDMVVGSAHASSVDSATDVYLLKLSATGAPVWLQTFGGPDRHEATVLTFDAHGDLFVGGNAKGALSCAAPAPGPHEDETGTFDFFLMRFDASSL